MVKTKISLMFKEPKILFDYNQCMESVYRSEKIKNCVSTVMPVCCVDETAGLTGMCLTKTLSHI